MEPEYPADNIKSSLKLPVKYKEAFEREKLKILQRIRFLLRAQSISGITNHLLIIKGNKQTLSSIDKKSNFSKFTSQKERFTTLRHADQKRKSLQEMATASNNFYSTPFINQIQKEKFNTNVNNKIKQLLSSGRSTPLQATIKEPEAALQTTLPANPAAAFKLNELYKHNTKISTQAIPLKSRALRLAHCRTSSIPNVFRSRNDQAMKAVSNNGRRLSSTQSMVKVHKIIHSIHAQPQTIHSNFITTNTNFKEHMSSPPPMTAKYEKYRTPLNKILDAIPLTGWGFEDDN